LIETNKRLLLQKVNTNVRNNLNYDNMSIKNISTPLVIIGLSVAFAIVVVGVYMTRGKSKFWISKKMLLGSLLLSLTSIVNQSCIVSCYDPASPNQIELDNPDYSSTIVININENTKLTGTIYDRKSKEFSFNITDLLNKDTLQVGNIVPSDGKFDESTEAIYIQLDKNLPVNEYLLNLYDTRQTEQLYPISTYRLSVCQE